LLDATLTRDFNREINASTTYQESGEVIFLPIWAFASKPPRTEAGSEHSLTLTQATELAVKNNLQTILAGERIVQARGPARNCFSQLLPEYIRRRLAIEHDVEPGSRGVHTECDPRQPRFPRSIQRLRCQSPSDAEHFQPGGRIRALSRPVSHGVDLAGEQQRYLPRSRS